MKDVYTINTSSTAAYNPQQTERCVLSSDTSIGICLSGDSPPVTLSANAQACEYCVLGWNKHNKSSLSCCSTGRKESILFIVSR